MIPVSQGFLINMDPKQCKMKLIRPLACLFTVNEKSKDLSVPGFMYVRMTTM